MRKYYYSPSAKGFYLSDVHSTIPSDKIEITEVDYKALLGKLSTGEELVFANGKVSSAEVDHTQSITWDNIRSQRDALLAASDYTQLADAPLTDEEKQAWTDYRAALRALPDSGSEPSAVVWPTPPATSSE